MLTAALAVRHAACFRGDAGHLRETPWATPSVFPQDGRLHSWLAAVPKSAAAHGSRVAVLSSLHEATVVDAARPGGPHLHSAGPPSCALTSRSCRIKVDGTDGSGSPAEATQHKSGLAGHALLIAVTGPPKAMKHCSASLTAKSLMQGACL